MIYILIAGFAIAVWAMNSSLGIVCLIPIFGFIALTRSIVINERQKIGNQKGQKKSKAAH